MPEEKIPRVIHYCWFSGEEIPFFLKQCMDSWREVMPDYKFRLWDANSFDFNSVPFVKEAFESKKWAFVADYIRLHALFHEGGIYLDSDVRVFKRFDEFLKYDFFTSHEFHPYNFTAIQRKKLNELHLPINKDDYIRGLNVQAAIMGSARGNPFMMDCLEFYHDKHLLGDDGKLLCQEFIIGPYISKKAEKYGYRYEPVAQLLSNNMLILPPEVFVGNTDFLTRDSYAVHLCNGSWKEKTRFEEFKYGVRNRYPSLIPLIILWERVERNVKKLWK